MNGSRAGPLTAPGLPA